MSFLANLRSILLATLLAVIRVSKLESLRRTANFVIVLLSPKSSSLHAAQERTESSSSLSLPWAIVARLFGTSTQRRSPNSGASQAYVAPTQFAYSPPQ